MSLEQDVIEKLQAILDEYREAKQRELDAMQCPFAAGEVAIYDNPSSVLFPGPCAVVLKEVRSGAALVKDLTSKVNREVPIKFLKKVKP